MACGTSCVEVRGYRSPDGYGRVRVSGKKVLAHRAAWIRAHGPVPDGLFVLHDCDNPACVNVDHLHLGTKKDNAREMVDRGRHKHPDVRGSKHPGAKLTDAKVRRVFALAALGKSRREIAAVMGVSRCAIIDVLLRRRWAHVEVLL